MATNPGRAAREAVDAARLFGRSSRSLARQVRGRYATDLIAWPYRHEFAPAWQTTQWIPGWFSEGSAAVLYGLVRSGRPATVVEIGSYLGRSTVLLALAVRREAPGGRVVAVDPHTGDRQQLAGLSAQHLPSFDLFQQHLRATGVDDVVTPLVTTSVDAAAAWSGPIDLLYVDGWHSFDAVLADGEAWLPHLSSGGVVVFDDYVAYPEVGRAVDQLAAAGHFQLWGTVFGQALGGRTSEPPAPVRRALRLSGARVLRGRTSAPATR